ncbi:COBRA-like protein 10 [Benincasa hispida]|uniref:COBRA-like protein 10 n=1 Tax=Benincasa hispida TaxID=102211 RepID=UPI001900B507|nr:COBRA-like protein 10 [Benincasa hispida]
MRCLIIHTPFWLFFVLVSNFELCFTQDYIIGDSQPAAAAAAAPPEQNECNGIFLTYTFLSREREFPYVKNVSAQAWAFRAQATVVNAGPTELDNWKMYIGFQHREILVSAAGAVLVDGSDFPAAVGKGATLAGYTQTDLKTSIETAGDYNQIQATIDITGTQFGVKKNGIPMPKTIRLENEGFKCPQPRRHRNKSYMHVCCKKDPKFKQKPPKKTKFLPRQNGDLSLTYDVLQAYGNNYLAQVTIDNNNPLGRLDHWNLTWEWKRGEFISTMRGAYTHKIDYSDCIFGPQGQYYQDFDFSQVMNCEKNPIIADLPSNRANDSKVGKLPFCCKNGTILPPLMDQSKARSIFQLQVYKLPPDFNRTALYPPQKWKINGILNPSYKCGAPIRVEPTQFPDSTGLQAITTAIASWQVVCNITTPKPKQSRCCVSFSAYYNDSVIPCNTCACGCDETQTCNPNSSPLLLPPEALLVPFDNRTVKAKAWAKIKHLPIPKKLPCPDNCGVSLNWHINSDYISGWTARITLFNWEEYPFEDWFAAVQLDKAAKGYENVYSFNGTKLPPDMIKNTILFQGLEGLNYLMGETNGTDPSYDPRVPGKQQSVISFTKKNLRNLNIKEGDGFPSKVYFNGEECALPPHIPLGNGAAHGLHVNSEPVMLLLTIMAFFILFNDGFH